MTVQRQAAAQPALRKIEHIVDQTRHAPSAVADMAANVAQCFLVRPSTQQHVDPRIN